ncbi:MULTISPECIES: chemotaxis protein CheA [unclassified Actinotalea]|uniref:chemotaxis protein CheA n=1 Tax=unclassified Actinotalea TaxID=2638618 RepID=UPI0015F518A5|nr:MULTISPECIES: chemotaxis protein CheA [unclassified Actinotalea]
MEDLDEIVHEFLVESHENLDQLDSDLVALEAAPGSRDLLSSIFRTIHTIKGTSGFLAFSALERVTHAGENLLVELRDGLRSMDHGTTDVLLQMVDVVRDVLRRIESDGGEGEVDVDAVVRRIETLLAGTPGAGSPDAGATAPVEHREDLPAPEASVPEVPVPVPAPASAPPASRTIRAKQAGPAASADREPDPAEPEPAASRSAADGSIRVDVDLLDALMRQVGELVLARNAISRLAGGTTDVDLVRAAQRLSLIASELQEGVMKTRMQPIEHVWSKVPRMVRDVAAACDKQVRVELTGGDTELDRSLLEAVKDPLTHLIRNAVDHGVEAPAARSAAGKPAQGVVSLRAYHAGGQVVVEVSDDGAGIDVARVAAKAVDRGLRTAEQVADAAASELLQLLFLPGFSTAESVTNVSGRGVGMDVVRTRIEAIGGTVDVDSELGTGTTWRLRIPLTLAIMPALTVACDGELYAIPQVSLLELVALDAQASGAIEYVRSAPVYRLRGELLPLVDLREVLGRPARADRAGAVITVLQADTQRFGLLVDRVLNTEEIVVKPLSGRLKAIGLYAGATLLGDGRVSLILDVQAIGRRAMVGDGGLERARSAEDRAAVVETVPVLVAGIGGGRRVAIPLAAVTRLEKLPADVLEHVGGREVIQYRGAITPVVRLDRLLAAAGGGDERDERDELTVVVSSRRGRSVAIVVDEIVDIVDDDVAAHSDLGDHGTLGSTVLEDKVTELLDVRAAVAAADPLFFADEPAPADLAVLDPADLDHLDVLVGATR